MKGILPDDTLKFLGELHQDRNFEIFTAIESNLEHETRIKLFQVSIDYQVDGDHIQLSSLDKEKRGIWFTPNSMFSGKRKIEFIVLINAIAPGNHMTREALVYEMWQERKF